MAAALEAILAEGPPRAGGFIVTLYGDVVLPRGGELSMAAIIETCAAVGISETLVRTAVSRLVAAGQLEGRRLGRRSFYRLTPAAAAEYAEAGRVNYGPPSPACLRLVTGPSAALDRLVHHARLAPDLALGPDRGPLPERCGVLAGPVIGDAAAWAPLAGRLWDLATPASAYRRFLSRFAALPPADASEALALRLLLVDSWRRAALVDPHLPPALLPPDWPGPAARALFARLYRALTPPTEAAIAERLDNAAGSLPATSAEAEARQAMLDMSHENAKFELRCDVFSTIK